MNARSITGFAILLAAAIGSWYLASTLKEPDQEITGTGNLQQGYYLKSARILGTGDSGKLLYEIEAEYAEQISRDQIAFESVQVRYSPDSDVPWSVTADEAVITGDQQRLTLTGHVIATSSSGFNDSVTEIRTDWLELQPDAYLAHTDQRVQIRIGERSITATGMEASLLENRLHLKSNVSGKFVP